MSDPKVILHNRCKGRAVPQYITTRKGEDHDPTFTSEVQIRGTTWGRGKGKRKAEAERAAAQDALTYVDGTGAFRV